MKKKERLILIFNFGIENKLLNIRKYFKLTAETAEFGENC